MIKKMMMVMIAVLCMISIVSVANAAFTYEDTGASTLDLISSDDTSFVVNMGGDLYYDSWELGIYSATQMGENVYVVNEDDRFCIFDENTVGSTSTLQFTSDGYGAYNVTMTGSENTAEIDGTFGVYLKYVDSENVTHILYSQNFFNDENADWFEIYDVGGDTSIAGIPDKNIGILFAGTTPTPGPYGAAVPITATHFLLGSGIVGLLAVRKRD